MKPAYDQLGAEYEGSASVLIGDADCTGSGKELCDSKGVSGYPTIKYFNAEFPDGKDYSGGRDFDSLKKFADETLAAACLVDDPSGCSTKAPPAAETPPLPRGAPRDSVPAAFAGEGFPGQVESQGLGRRQEAAGSPQRHGRVRPARPPPRPSPRGSASCVRFAVGR